MLELRTTDSTTDIEITHQFAINKTPLQFYESIFRKYVSQNVHRAAQGFIFRLFSPALRADLCSILRFCPVTPPDIPNLRFA